MKTKTLTMILQKKNLFHQYFGISCGKESFLIKFNMNSCTADYLIEKRVSGSKLLFIYAIFPSKVPINKRKDVAVYTTLLNNNLSFGCWELNMENGSLRFRISYIYDDNASTFEVVFVENLEQSIKYTDLCIPGFFSVIYADKDPYEQFLQLTGHVDVRLN